MGFIGEKIKALTVLASLPHNYIFFAADDPTYTILEITNLFLRTLNRNREDILGKSLLEAFPDTPESNARLLIDSFRKVLITQAPDSMAPVRYDLPDPESYTLIERWWKADNYPFFSADGAIDILIHTAMDITTLKPIIGL